MQQTNNPSKLHRNLEPYSGADNGVHDHPMFIRLSATIPADWRTNGAQNVHDVDMNKEGVLFGLCRDQFGPKPLCFWTGCSPRAPLKATSHTFHNPIHSNKYVQSCKLEWLLICQISCCQGKMWAWKQGLATTLIANLERKKHSFSQNNTVTVGETQFLFLLESKKKNKKLDLPWCSQSTVFMNQRV